MVPGRPPKSGDTSLCSKIPVNFHLTHRISRCPRKFLPDSPVGRIRLILRGRPSRSSLPSVMCQDLRLVDEQISSFIFCPRGMDAPPRRRVRPWACRPLLGALTPVGVHTAMALRARRSETWAALALGTRADRPAKPTAALPTIRYALAEAEETCLFVH